MSEIKGAGIDCDADSMMLCTLKRCYQKHSMNDSSIGWDELCDELSDTLCNEMGVNNFNQWVEHIKTMRD